MRLAISTTMMCMLVGCALNPFLDAPGEGEKASRGYRLAAPLIAALEGYRSINGRYPDSLELLVPSLVQELPPTQRSDQEGGIEYFRTERAYVLRFRYSGPGTNSCEYKPQENWKCYGAY